MREEVHYLVFNPMRDKPRFRHETYISAVNEAERLAKLHPGERFYVLIATGFAHVAPPPPVFTELSAPGSEIPF